VKESDLIPLLDAIICKVFDREEEFMRDVYRPNQSWDGELVEFYMASERCRLTVLLHSGEHITDTVKTQDVLDWIEGI
jgi:hypothetical protein